MNVLIRTLMFPNYGNSSLALLLLFDYMKKIFEHIEENYFALSGSRQVKDKIPVDKALPRWNRMIFTCNKKTVFIR